MSTLLALAAAGFLTSLSDVPLPHGYAEIGAPIAMDSADGRLVLAEAGGPGPAEAVGRFYRDALPPLGWRPTAAPAHLARFERGGEVLAIVIEPAADGRIRVRYHLTTIGAERVSAGQGQGSP